MSQKFPRLKVFWNTGLSAIFWKNCESFFGVLVRIRWAQPPPGPRPRPWPGPFPQAKSTFGRNGNVKKPQYRGHVGCTAIVSLLENPVRIAQKISSVPKVWTTAYSRYIDFYHERSNEIDMITTRGQSSNIRIHYSGNQSSDDFRVIKVQTGRSRQH